MPQAEAQVVDESASDEKPPATDIDPVPQSPDEPEPNIPSSEPANRSAAQPTEKRAPGESAPTTAAAESAGRAPPQGGSSRATPPTRKKAGNADPVSALRRSRDLFAKSQGKTTAGDHQGAYQDACAAWELVNSCRDDDVECRTLASTIFGRLDTLAEAANRQAKSQGGTGDDKTLIDK